MIETPLTLIDQPVTKKLYKPYALTQLPKLIMGFAVNNKYDETRLKIKKVIKPKYIVHNVGDGDELRPRYFHGIELRPRRKVSHLCSVIHKAMPVTLETYRNILKYNRLTCDNAAQHLRDGVYPIDMTCVTSLSTNKYKNDFLLLRTLLENSEKLPWFSNWTEFNIFMLCPSFLHR